jgi:hypothetical protein
VREDDGWLYMSTDLFPLIREAPFFAPALYKFV